MSKEVKSTIINVIKNTLISFAVCILELLVLSLLVLIGVIKEDSMQVLAMIVAISGAIINGYLNSKHFGKRMLIYGFISGLSIFIIISLLRLIVFKSLIPEQGGDCY